MQFIVLKVLFDFEKRKRKMLTSIQLNKLELLTNHFKYGKLLSDAIEIWKQDKIQPVRGNYGIFYGKDSKKVVLDLNDTCCLIGAALIKKEIANTTFAINAANIFDIDIFEIYDLIRGFDQLKREKTKAYNFGFEVSKIIFGEI